LDQKQALQAVEFIQSKYAAILGSFEAVLIVKMSSFKDKTFYCFTAKDTGIEFIEKSATKSKTTLDYSTGIVEKNHQIIRNGLELIYNILKKIDADIKNKKVTFLTRGK
jgi:hypothetical protein